MSEAVVISAFAGSGDVYAIFGGGLSVPDEYEAILYQHGGAIGRLSPGTYNAAIVLQSLSFYDGSDSSLYWVRRGEFDVAIHVDGLPDPGDIGGRLSGHLHLRFEVTDPTNVINNLLKGATQIDASRVVAMVIDDVRNLLDPIVACETRENLFRPSIFHETASLTLIDYVNNVLGDKGLALREVASMTFERVERRPSVLPAADHERRPRGVSAAPGHGGGHGAAPPSAGSPAPPPHAPGVAASAHQASMRAAAAASSGHNVAAPSPPPPDPAPRAAPMPAAASGNRPGLDTPGARSRAAAPGVDRMRAALASALLSANWNDFARLHDHQSRAQWLRNIDADLLLSNDKISELAQRLMPEQFDFRWAWNFFHDQQVLFDAQQMREFQTILASISYDRKMMPGDYNAAMLDREGRALSPDTSRHQMVQEQDYQARGAAAPAQDDVPIADLGGGHVQASQADFEPWVQAQQQPQQQAGSGQYQAADPASHNITASDVEYPAAGSGSGAHPVPGSGSQAGYRPPSYVEDIQARRDSFHGSESGDSSYKRSYRSRSESIEPDVGADDLSPAELGELEVMLNHTQTLVDKRVSRWVLVLNNKSPIPFSRVKISVRAESLVTAGSGVITDFAVGTRRTLELKIARTRGIKDGSISISAIAYAEGGTYPYVFTAQGEVAFRPSTFGNEHLVSITPDGGNYKVLSSSEVMRVSADVAETHGSAIGADDMRLFPMKPNPKMTQQLRSRLPSAERGLCPMCENETPRKYGTCQVCGVTLPRWFNKEPVMLTSEYSNARARVERARLWVEGEDRETSVFVVVGNRVSIGRRHDNDVVLRVFGGNGRVDERRTTELSRNSGAIDYSQGAARFTCLNRHGLRYRGKFVPCDSSFDLPEESRLEFINRQGEPILTLIVTIIYPSGNDETGGLVGPQAIYIRQERDSRGAGCLFLLKSVTMGFVQQNGVHRLMIPGGAHDIAGRLVYHEECLWFEPDKSVAVKKDRGGEMFEVQSNQLLRLDDNVRLDFRSVAVKAQVFHAKGMAFA